jgi:hypothetical protein
MGGSLTSCLREPVFKFLSIRPNADMVRQRDFFAFRQVRSTLQHNKTRCAACALGRCGARITRPYDLQLSLLTPRQLPRI